MSSSRRQYPFYLIEPKWQKVWDESQAFRAFNPGEEIPANHPFAQRHKLSGKVSAAQLPPKFYILDMFPYPSGAGLHVGHPEGYTATDILARYKRAQGFNVLHPMGWDAFGLPAEQYAVKTGQHPRQTTEENIATFKRQIQSLGFSYDWTRELATTDPDYFRWTQWIFLKLYNSYFDLELNKAQPIELLKDALSENPKLKNKWKDNAFLVGTHEGWLKAPEEIRKITRTRLIENSRLAYVSEQPVWWCEQLGTVLANEEVVDGKSEVGGFPVVRKPMRQWMLRITKYSERLLQDLDIIDWTDSLKEMQRNWIGRSEGAEIRFDVKNPLPLGSSLIPKLTVFTTRPDTIFGATYMVVAPEHWLVQQYRPSTWPANVPDNWKHNFAVEEIPATPIDAIQKYQKFASSKSDLERTELAKDKTGIFSGMYAINPATQKEIPIFIADYVLASYGTGAIMAVPAHDTRDFEFAKKFNLPIVQVVEPPAGKDWQGFTDDGIAVNSASAQISLDGLPTAKAKNKIIVWLQSEAHGRRTINYKLRDWLFSRQRYWGEPFPIVWKIGPDGESYHEALPESALPVLPPTLEDYKPTATGEPPLARAKDWVNLPDGSVRETNTMPQWAGSCWYYLRYLDAKNNSALVGKDVENYWMDLVRGEWQKQFRELYDFALNNPNNEKRFVTFGKVSEEEAARLESQTGLKLNGFRRFIDNYAVMHIWNEHSDAKKEISRGLVAVTFDDFLLIPQIVAFPDKVSPAGKTAIGLDGILYEKRINGWICYVEEVRAKRDLLATKTFYKKSATASHAGEGLAQTSETLRHTNSDFRPETMIVKPARGVDLYVGGTEHAVLHLLYARFWHKVLFDLGYVSTPEPFFKLVNQGMVLGEDNQKMSKSRGNVIPVDVPVAEVGTDSLRLYEMFMGPLEAVKPWSSKGVEGVYRFLGRVWRLFVDEKSETAFEQAETLATEAQSRGELLELILLDGGIIDIAATPAQLKTLHACIKKVTEDLDGMRFNTAISAMMVFINEAMTWQTKPLSVMKAFLQLLAPFAPHIAEELWARLHSTFGQTAPSLAYAEWPKFDATLLIESEIEIPVSVNGKVRDVIKVDVDADNATLEATAKASEKVQPFIAGKAIKKVIFVPKKMVNLIVG